MGLNTDIVRAGGQPYKLSLDSSGQGVSWTWWHLMRFAEAIRDENPTEYDSDGLIDKSKLDSIGPYPYGYVFKQYHCFTALETDIWARGGTEGALYKLEIFVGDTYNCWR